MNTRRDVLLGAMAALIAGAAYLPALRTDFTADDYFILARVRDYGGLSDPLTYFGFGFFDYYRPLGFLSHAADWELWGLNAAGFHLTSVLLHATNAALVFALARRVAGAGAALLAAVLFGVHAGLHETVYWAAARFDLLATALVLAATLLLTARGRFAYALGMLAFAGALLAKESAAALPLIVAAWDVFIARRPWPDVVRRAVPLLVVGALYVLLRSYGAGLAADGGRLPKLVLLAGGMTALVLVARAGAERVLSRLAGMGLPMAPAWFMAGGLVIAALTWVPMTATFVREKLGFAAYAAWVLGSPAPFAPPPGWVFVPESFVHAIPGLLVALGVLALLWAGRRWMATRPPVVFAAAFTAAALLPVLSMTGGARYLYLASAGAALVAALVLTALARQRQAVAAGVAIVWLLVSGLQLAEAASAWRWAGDFTSRSLDAMASSAPGCESRDLVMVTAPVGLRGVYSNLLWDGLAVRSPCPPRSIATLLRVVGVDAEVEASRPAPDTIELRVPDYQGQFTASSDLRRYDVAVPAGGTAAIDTPVGRIDTWAEAGVQRFRITLSPGARDSAFFAYGAGEMRLVGEGR